MSHLILTDLDGKQFRATQQQADALATLSVARAGGLATVYGYVATSGRVKPETANLTILTRFSTTRLYERKAVALADITFSAVRDAIAKVPKLAALSEVKAIELFNSCKAKMTESMGKTLGKDAQEGKLTYISLVGLEEAKKIAGQTAENALAALEIFGEKAWLLRELTNATVNRKS